MKFLGIFILIVVAWFFLFGLRLINFFATVSEKGLRATECGTDGCTDTVFVLSTIWTFSFLIIVPLIVPLIILFLWKKKRKNVT